MLGANAAGRTSSVDAYDLPKGFQVPGAPVPNQLDIFVGDDVVWHVIEGTHTVTPKDEKQWGQKGSNDLDPNASDYTATHFDAPGEYVYYCKHHGGLDKDGNPTGMWGVILVSDPNATTTTTAAPVTTTTQAPTTTTRPAGPAPTTPTTAPAPAGTAGTHAPVTAAPAPTTTATTKADKEKKPKDETTTTTVAPPAAPVDIPAEAIVPSLPGGTNTTVQNGAVDPGALPDGEAVASLKDKPTRKGMKMLIFTGLGIGALGAGAAGYKFANRSSKYFPA
jgi:plastocyanin